MTTTKRLFDICVALIGLALALPILLVLIPILLITSGRPILYVSERMKTQDTPFELLKFRTMTVAANDSGVSGGDKSARITPIGRFLRTSRLDELPQLWNILRGDMSFVGPRPPLRQYVEAAPELYSQVLRCRPGITGLATVVFRHREESLLASCTTVEDTDAVYRRRCVPTKARLDLIYQRHQSVCFDVALLVRTFSGLGR